MTAPIASAAIASSAIASSEAPSQAFTLVLDSGTFTLTGFDIDLTVDRSLLLETGFYTLTGFDVGLNPTNSTLILETGTFTLTGFPVNLIPSVAETGIPNMSPIDMSQQARIIQIQQGESLPFRFDGSEYGLDGNTASGTWICNINVRAYPKGAVILTRLVPPTATNLWIGYLTSTETAALDTGTYRLTGVLTNSTTDEKVLPPVRFTVSQAWG